MECLIIRTVEKPHENIKPSNFCTWFCKWTRFLQNFNRVSGFPAAILLDFRCNIGQKFSWRFVAQPLLGKVTKPFHFIPNASEIPLKRSVWGANYPPPNCNRRVKLFCLFNIFESFPTHLQSQVVISSRKVAHVPSDQHERTIR